MTFENQFWLILTPVIVLMIAGLFAFGLRRREALLSRFAATRLLDQLTEKASHKRTLLKAGLILLAFALIGVALARPQYGVDWIERKARGLDIVFVLDSSKSMLATDLRPTRLNRAKLAIIDLVKRLESDHIGLVVFAGNAFLQTPPTLDYAAFRENLDSIGHDTITRGGSDLGQAIREAAKAFPQENNFKVVILLTDGEDQEQRAIETTREVAKDGIKVYAIGIGTPQGEYLKIRNEQGIEEFIRDANGQPVRSQLDESTLQEIAKLTGGSYSRLSDQSLNSLYNSVIATLPRKERESELQEARIERFQWAIAAACIFLVLEIFIRRRGKGSINMAAVLAACYLLLTPAPTEAQDAPLELNEQPPKIAYQESSDPRILYNEAYERLSAGEYEEAKRLYERVIETSKDLRLERDALYNMAHAANQIGETALQAQDFQAAIDNWKEAETLFKSANEIDPTDKASVDDAESTQARRKALEALIKEQEPQDQQSSENSDQEQQKSEDQSEEGEQNQEGQQDQESGERNEQQPSEQQSSENQDSQDQDANGEEQPGQEGSESEQGQNGKEQSGEKGSESDSSDASESEEPSEESGAESTANPAEDMQQQAASEGEESESEPNEDDGQSMQPVEATEGENGETANSQSGSMTVEGMSVSEAQDLLDSLRGSERLLPFSEPSDETSRSNRKGEIRDW
jgi:Ca-activated chloride channel family protein